MDEDLDQMVERISALFLSENPGEIKKGSAEVRATPIESGVAQGVKLSRLLQELAAYRGGAVLDHLLAGAHWKHGHVKENDVLQLLPEINHYHACCSGLATLTVSMVLLDRTLQSVKGVGCTDRAQELYLNVCSVAEEWARKLERGQKHLNTMVKIFIVTPLDCLSNVGRSAVFREGMRRASGERSLFHQLGLFLSPQFTKMVSDLNGFHIRNVLSRLVTSLAGSLDSQLWALDKGLLKIMAAIYECVPSQSCRDAGQGDETPAYRCNWSLLVLLSTEATAEKLRAHNALDGFRPHKRKISDAANPNHVNFWGYLEAQLQGRQDQVQLLLRSGQTATLDVSGEPRTLVPVVCSWKHCKAGPEPAGTKFGKCGLCHVARYCSKQHQKLHWPMHKAHCQVDPQD